MHWAIAFHPGQVVEDDRGRLRLVVPPVAIAEHCIPAAVEQGWIILGRDSSTLSEPIPKPMDMNLLRGPVRNSRRPPRGYGAVRGDDGDTR